MLKPAEFASVTRLAHDLGLSEPTIRRAIDLGGVKPVSRGIYEVIKVKLAIKQFSNEHMAVGHATSGRGNLEAAQVDGSGKDGDGSVFGTLSAAKRETVRLNNEKIQFDLDVRRGAYVKRSDVNSAGDDMVRRATFHYLSLPERAAPRLVGVTDRAEIEAILAEECRRSLREMALITTLVDEILG